MTRWVFVEKLVDGFGKQANSDSLRVSAVEFKWLKSTVRMDTKSDVESPALKVCGLSYLLHLELSRPLEGAGLLPALGSVSV